MTSSIWKAPEGRWAFMPSGEGEMTALEVTDVLAEGRSEFQDFAILETRAFGQVLVLDGQVQSCSSDEWIYHESLVLPPMCVPDEPRRVAVLGGGEGAMLREVLRHPSVESVVMVDIDGEVVEACREHLASHHAGAFDDPRVTVIADDARGWLERDTATYDVILVDLTEPLAGGPSAKLFTKQFYELVRSSLSPGGVMALQAGAVRPSLAWAFGRVISTLRDVFPRVRPYSAWVTSFFEEWGFAVAGGDEVERLGPDLIDRRLAERSIATRFLDGETFRGMTCFSRYIRGEMERHTEIITDEKPLVVPR